MQLIYTLLRWFTDEGAAPSSDEELSRENEMTIQDDTQMKSEDRQLKDKLLRRYGSHISSLKLEFCKKKKKGKLPKEGRQTLLEWWNIHSKWPYPTVGANTWWHCHRCSLFDSLFVHFNWHCVRVCVYIHCRKRIRLHWQIRQGWIRNRLTTGSLIKGSGTGSRRRTCTWQ